MLIEGSSRSSGALVGEHQPDELMRDGGRWAGRPLVVMSEMKVSQGDVAARVQPWRGVGASSRQNHSPPPVAGTAAVIWPIWPDLGPAGGGRSQRTVCTVRTGQLAAHSGEGCPRTLMGPTQPGKAKSAPGQRRETSWHPEPAPPATFSAWHPEPGACHHSAGAPAGLVGGSESRQSLQSRRRSSAEGSAGRGG